MTCAFVAGATGYTGRAVVEELARRDGRVVAHVRPDSSELASWKDRFGAFGAEVDTTPWQAEAMTRTFQALQPTHVFALLGTTRKRAQKEGQTSATLAYEKIDYGLTVMLLDALAAAGVSARFIYLSSLGVTPDTGNAYLSARARVEATLGQRALPYTIVRPSFITGPDRDDGRPMERAGAAVADALLALTPRRLRDRYRSITNQGLARALVRAGLADTPGNHIISSAEVQALARADAA